MPRTPRRLLAAALPALGSAPARAACLGGRQSGLLTRASSAGVSSAPAASSSSPMTLGVVAVGAFPYQAAYDPDNGKIYVANAGSNTVSVINPTVRPFTATTVADPNHLIQVPFGIIAVPGYGVYVANALTVSRIDNRTNTVTGNVSDPQHTFQDADLFAYVPPFNQLWVTNAFHTVSIVDLRSNSVTGTVNTMGYGVFGIAYDLASNDLYVAAEVSTPSSSGPGGVTVIDARTHATSAVADPGDTFQNPYGVAVNVDAGQVDVSSAGSSHLSLINPKTNTVTGTLPAGNEPQLISFDRAHHGLVPNWASNSLTIFNAFSNTVTATVADPSFGCPGSVAVTPNGLAFVVNHTSNTVTVLQLPQQ